MNTNDSNNPQNSGTGAGANYGSATTGTGMGNSTGLSNEGTSYNAGTGADYGTDPAAGTTGNYTEGSSMSGMFRDRESAEKTYNSLHSRGYGKDDVNLLMSDETRKAHFGDDTDSTELGDKAMEGAGVGSAIGGTAGAIIGAIAAIGTSVALPGLGLIIAGPLAAALAGAGAGGLTGGLVGALVGSGIPEAHAAEYEQGINNGGIVMGVKPRNAEDAKYFEDEFRRNNGDKIYRY
ncbi:hypothetical protein ACFQ48_00925 [Hymenobacter caeli]|uniref:Glycine zipper domain-containing protein n=1 Tax=Hymenobacter caeli TaxID=2735894 RepID=A0ABX2FJU5_9BACT|nr:hypothetical protein [Hymenobacter caeli]NRT17384.1 hypothetical protein [Hymenobacter caeli]